MSYVVAVAGILLVVLIVVMLIISKTNENTDKSLQKLQKENNISKSKLININQKALENTKNVIKKNFGDTSDIPEELRNTIINIYYKFALILENPNEILLKNDSNEFVFYTSAVKTLPEMISTYRSAIKTCSLEEKNRVTEMYLYMFKYQIPDVLSKRIITLRAISKSKNIDEIPELYKLI